MEQQRMFEEPKRALIGVEVELPWPPSANHYRGQRVMLPAAADMQKAFTGDWRELWKFIRSKTHNTTYLTEEATNYHATVEACVIRANARKYLTSKLKMTMEVWPPDLRRRDTSNLFKMVEDALCSASVFKDDSQIKHHTAIFHDEVVKFGRVLVRIEELP